MHVLFKTVFRLGLCNCMGEAEFHIFLRLPDGLKVAQNGYIVTGTGMGVDVLDPVGTLLVRVQTNYTVQNFAWTGPDLKTLWITGEGGISKVEWNLQGQKLE